MDKYRRVEKSKSHDESPVEANEIRITHQGNVRSYISYANGLFADKHERGVVLKAMGNAISKAVTVAEILKHRVEHLHQITQISSIETVDVYEPLEEGLDRIETKRHIPSISIQLSLDQLNKEDPGYQSPIPVELVSKSFDDRHETRKPFAARKNNAKRSEKKKGKAAAGPATSGGEEDEVEDQENAKSHANTVAATDDGDEEGAVKEGGKPARGDHSTKRGRGRGGRSGGRGAGRKLREEGKTVEMRKKVLVTEKMDERAASEDAEEEEAAAVDVGDEEVVDEVKEAKHPLQQPQLPLSLPPNESIAQLRRLSCRCSAPSHSNAPLV
ncbi:Aspartyl protease family a01b [Globisporangium polare]